MKVIGRKTVLTCMYDDKQEMEMHKKSMIRNGWRVRPANELFYRKGLIVEYQQEAKKGAYL